MSRSVRDGLEYATTRYGKGSVVAGVTHQVNLTVLDCYLTDCGLDGSRFVWVALQQPKRNWSTINQPYFRDTIVPAITTARKLALKLPQTGLTSTAPMVIGAASDDGAAIDSRSVR